MDILTAYFPQEEEKSMVIDKEVGNVYFGDEVIQDIQLI